MTCNQAGLITRWTRRPAVINTSSNRTAYAEPLAPVMARTRSLIQTFEPKRSRERDLAGAAVDFSPPAAESKTQVGTSRTSVFGYVVNASFLAARRMGQHPERGRVATITLTSTEVSTRYRDDCFFDFDKKRIQNFPAG